MPDPLVRYRLEGPLAILTLDSPHNRNALSRRLVAELHDGLERADGDHAVRAVLLTAAGPVFCSGADLTEATADGMEEAAGRIVALQRLIVTLRKPVVTQVLGAVRAGGIGIVAASDVAISAADASYALTEVKLGLAAAVVSLTVHARMTPRGGALATLGGESFTGTQAADWGLVTLAVPAEELDDVVRETCASLATGSPQGLRESKRVLNQALVARIDEYGEQVAALSASLFASDEARAAMTAFLERGKK